jgi:hypothetical protein
MLGAQAFRPGLAATSFDYAYGYPWPVGGVATVLPRPNLVLVAQAVRDGLAIASFDAASPHYPWCVGCISIAGANPMLLVFLCGAITQPVARALHSRRAACVSSQGPANSFAVSDVVWFPTLDCLPADCLPQPLEGGGRSAEKRGWRRAPHECTSRLRPLRRAMSDNNESKPAPALGPARDEGNRLQAAGDVCTHHHRRGAERFAAILRRLDEPTAPSKLIGQGGTHVEP